MSSVPGAIAAATAAGKRAKERRHQLRDALRRHHPTARRLVLIASDDLIAAPSIAMASRPATAIAYPERVTSMRSNYHIPVFKPADGGVVWSPPAVSPLVCFTGIEIGPVAPATRLSRSAQFLDLVEHHLDPGHADPGLSHNGGRAS